MIFKDIKKISSDAVALITEFGSPEMTESLDIIKEITVAAQGIMESLEHPLMVNNIENIRLSFKSMQAARNSLKNISSQLAETGIIDEAKITINSMRSKMNAINSEQNINELVISVKETLRSVQSFTAEFKSS
jgi:AmiR/NasT family two-component response regulator